MTGPPNLERGQRVRVEGSSAIWMVRRVDGQTVTVGGTVLGQDYQREVAVRECVPFDWRPNGR